MDMSEFIASVNRRTAGFLKEYLAKLGANVASEPGLAPPIGTTTLVLPYTLFVPDLELQEDIFDDRYTIPAAMHIAHKLSYRYKGQVFCTYQIELLPEVDMAYYCIYGVGCASRIVPYERHREGEVISCLRIDVIVIHGPYQAS